MKRLVCRRPLDVSDDFFKISYSGDFPYFWWCIQPLTETKINKDEDKFTVF